MLVISMQMAIHEDESKDIYIERANDYLQHIYDDNIHPVQIIFPEMWTVGFWAFDQYKVKAEPQYGPVYDLLSFWAKKFSCYIHTGSFVESDMGKFYNTSLLLDPNGNVIGKYRKIHLFSYKSKEAEILSPGSSIAVFSTEYGKVGMATCYDLRFPELFRIMSRFGCEYFLISSSWPIERIKHWELFNKARAVENQCFTISCNAVGVNGGAQLGGHSMITSPCGDVLCTGALSEGYILCEINTGDITKYRTSFPILADRHIF